MVRKCPAGLTGRHVGRDLSVAPVNRVAHSVVSLRTAESAGRPIVTRFQLLAAGLLSLSPWLAAAAPYSPTDDTLVLQRVLPNADPRLRAVRDKAAALAQHPDDPDLALDLASRQLSLGVAEADPRFVGYAQATLAPWWRQPEPPVPLRVLRARILQAQHDFAASKRDLLAVLAVEPNHVDAHLVLAGISETTGDLATARTACDDLARIRPTLAATACAASVDSVSGHSDQAYTRLSLIHI